MPWSTKDAERHTSKADTADKRRVWAQVANQELKDHGNEGRAIRAANAAVARMRP